jgi:VWA domain-containing protein
MTRPAVHSRLQSTGVALVWLVCWLLGWDGSGRATIGLASGDEKPPAASATSRSTADPPVAKSPFGKAANGAPAAKSDGKTDANSDVAKHEAAQFKAARLEIQRNLRSKDADVRVKAIRQLQAYPLVEAAKLAMGTGFNDESQQVRAATYETLLKFSASQEICDYFLDLLHRQARRGDLTEKSVPMLAALLASPVDEIDLGTRDLLDSVLYKNKQGELFVTELADQLGAHSSDDSVPPLIKLSKSQLFANHFGVRRAVVDALVRLDRLSAVAELIRFLADVHGEARADILKYLTAITGQNFLNDSKAWAVWWRQNQDTFVLPPPNARVVAQIAEPDTAYYYGLPIYAQKLVFVLDTSGSMSQFNRLEAAKRELSDAIRGLNEESQFAIVIFNNSVDVWQHKLVPANALNKRVATAYVQSQMARLNTASYDALEAAFSFDAEAIFFLSDGEPTSGKFVAPVDIINVISVQNRSRRESIYTIGLAPGLPESPLEWFMKTLAEQNAGQYRRVDK